MAEASLQRMQPCDHVLAHALTALCAMRVHDAGRVEMWRAVIEHDCAVAADRDIPQVQHLAEVGRRVLTVAPYGAGWAAVMLQASEAVMAFSEWRLGLALEAHRATQGAAA